MTKITVYCQPGAKQTQVAGWHDGKLKIQLKAPPVDGAANKALIAFMAELCQVAKSSISIEQGSSSRTKRLHIDGLDDAQLLAVFARFGGADAAPEALAPSTKSAPRVSKNNSKK